MTCVNKNDYLSKNNAFKLHISKFIRTFAARYISYRMTTDRLVPDYVFESSWEVCNKVGGIYTVLSTRAKTLQEMFPDHIIFIGPDVWGEKPCPYFQQDDKLLEDFQRECAFAHLGVKVGRWDIPGRPIAVLVDFKPYYERKNEIYTRLWEDFQVDSLHAYGDYDEASMFS